MAKEDSPDGISERHLRPARGLRAIESVPVWVLGLVLLIALTGALGGGKARTSTDATAAADLSVRAPHVLRSGMFFEMEIDVAARSEIADATIALPPALWHEMTINTMVPAAGKEEFKARDFRFSYGRLDPGETLRIKIDGQINPPLTFGTRGDVRLLDGETPLATVPVAIRVLP